jgi:hypothetical protein
MTAEEWRKFWFQPFGINAWPVHIEHKYIEVPANDPKY